MGRAICQAINRLHMALSRWRSAGPSCARDPHSSSQTQGGLLPCTLTNRPPTPSRRRGGRPRHRRAARQRRQCRGPPVPDARRRGRVTSAAESADTGERRHQARAKDRTVSAAALVPEWRRRAASLGFDRVALHQVLWRHDPIVAPRPPASNVTGVRHGRSALEQGCAASRRGERHVTRHPPRRSAADGHRP
jgi:hypothetical protein